MKICYLTIFTLCLLGTGSLDAQTMVINTGQTPQQLVWNLVGQGINPTNISGQFSSLSGGTFVNNGVPGFSLSSGILLSSGELLPASTVAAYHHSTDIGLPGDSLLDIIVFPRITEDASMIEFDFHAVNDSVEFDFVFASEEYNDYANTNFNDVFAFFVTGPGFSPNTNIALLPGTAIPISINTVNNGNSGGTATGPCMNCAYYVDNVGTNAVGYYFDGYTTVIKIKFPVSPCDMYHFKIAVADAGDGIFDSAVMFEESSFIACPSMQAFQHGLAVPDTLVICNGGSATLTAPSGPQHAWNTGETTQSIVVSQPGTYSFIISDILGSCFAFSDSIVVVQQGIIQTPVIVQNVSQLSAPNLVPAPGITYQWNLGGIPIPGATQSTLTIPGNGCYTLTIFEGNCESTSNIICVTNTSLSELSAASIRIMPHPVTSTSFIETPFTKGSESTLQLFDLTGRMVRNEQQTGNLLRISKQELPAGIYFIQISNSEHQGNIMKKIMMQ